MGGTTQNPVSNYIGLATDLTLHLSATTEDSTTKDTTDTTGQWTEFDVTGRSGDINFSALVAVLTGDTTDVNGKYLADFIDSVSDTVVDWKLIFVSGHSNRTAGKTLCSGKGKLTNLQISAQNRQKASYSGTINLFGPVTVGSD